MDQIGRLGRNLEMADGEVPALGGDALGKVRLQYRTTDQGSGSGDIGRHACHTRPLGGALTGRGMGFLLIDARNGFNEENRTAIFWAVQHEWLSGA